MSFSRILPVAVTILGIAFIAAYWWGTRPITTESASVVVGNGPVIEIKVAGEANGAIRVRLMPELAPRHVERILTLAEQGKYDNVVFHRVIDGFMAQSGDVRYGVAGGDLSRAGMGGSDLPNLPAEFSDVPFDRGVMGMARSAARDSANSQFFIMFAPAPHLNGQYTVVGKVIEGLEVLDAIKRGTGANGEVVGTPDVIQSVRLVQ